MRTELNGLMLRACGLLEDPVVCRKVVTASAWCSVVALAVAPDVALAAFPIPGLDRLITDSQDHITTQGSLIGASLGLAGGAIRMMLTNFEGGIGHLVRTGAGGAVIGSSPEVASYVTG
jgi:hypothetical protein